MAIQYDSIAGLLHPAKAGFAMTASRKRKFIFVACRALILIFFSVFCFAEDNLELYTFASPAYKPRFYHLTNEFRCLVCQNQALADSNAPLAQDMRKQILLMLNHGATDKEITDFLVQRYGEFVRYRPPFNQSTILLWVMPGILLVAGLGAVYISTMLAKKR